MIKGLSLVGAIFLLIASSELFMIHHQISSKPETIENYQTKIAPNPQNRDIEGIGPDVSNQHIPKEVAVAIELKQWLSQLELNFLFESLSSLGAFHKSDLKYLDQRDRRRLWLETSLHSAALGQDAAGAINRWEGVMSGVETFKTVKLPEANTYTRKLISQQEPLLFSPPSPPAPLVLPKVSKAPSPQSQKSPPKVSFHIAPMDKRPAVNCDYPQLHEDRTINNNIKQFAVSFNNVAVYINSSPDGRRYFGENFQRNYYANRVVPGIKTWGARFPYLWVVMEETPESLQLVKSERCQVTTHPGSNVKEYNCDGKPIILSPCDNGYWGESGPCCKAEFAFRHLMVERRQLLDQIKWFLFADDDTFFVPHSMLRFLSGYNASEPIVISRGEPPSSLTYGRLHSGSVNKKGFTCNNPNVKIGMLQPAIFSVAALNVMNQAVVSGKAITKTCAAFGITHDNALGILSWMHQLKFYVKGSHGSLHQEMAGAFNVTLCEEKGVSKCYEQGFSARVDALRSSPAKFILHGVKLPHQFTSLHSLYSEPDMEACVGENAPFLFSEAQQPPLAVLEGYQFTEHGRLHLQSLLPSRRRETAPSKLSDWSTWPLFEPEHCMTEKKELINTPWEQHMTRLKTSYFSSEKPSHVY